MKTIFGLIVALLLSSGTSAQLADNFQVVDINGQSHSLYQDYLNQGDAMILGFFYVGAPMVTDLYPDLQNVMNTVWDSLPVNAILMSEADSNAELQLFAEELQLNIPLVANEGGAGSAMAPYVSGEFGTFFGYPMFVVIGPDGSVVFDPWGSDLTDILNNIQEAIYQVLNISSVEAISASKPTVYSSSGKLHVQNPTGNAVWFEVFGLSGRRICAQLLSPGITEVDVPSKGVVLYKLSTAHWVDAGKVWVGQ